MINSIISNSQKERLSFGNEWEIVNAMTDSAISGYDFFKFGTLHKRHPFFHKINLNKHWKKMLDSNRKMSLEQDSNCAAIDFCAYFQIFLLFLQMPIRRSNNIFINFNCFHLFLNLFHKNLKILWYFVTMLKREFFQLLNRRKSIIDFVSLVEIIYFFHF